MKRPPYPRGMPDCCRRAIYAKRRAFLNQEHFILRRHQAEAVAATIRDGVCLRHGAIDYSSYPEAQS